MISVVFGFVNSSFEGYGVWEMIYVVKVSKVKRIKFGVRY